MKKNTGFTLIELMIVVAIIAIIAAIAIPNLLRSRINANEKAGLGDIHQVDVAQTSYFASKGTYATSFDDLTGANPPFLNGTNWGALRGAYTCTMTGNATGYTVTATPLAGSANKTYVSNGSGEIVTTE